MSFVRKAALLAILAFTGSWNALAAGTGAHPGYGTVESVTRIAPQPSASAGASSAGPSRARYLVRVRLDDGSVQVREVRNPEVKKGQRALVTNAGDVVPE